MSLERTQPSPGSSLSDDRTIHRLVVLASPQPKAVGTTVAVTGPLVIGRAPGASAAGLTLDDAEASRTHAAIEPDGDGFTIRDLDSRNGSFVNGMRIESAPLADGDVLRVGSHLLLFERLTAGMLRGSLVPTHGSQLAGRSIALQAVQQQIARAAKLGAPVLVLGPSGAGKELVASELHRLSGRAGRYVPVNCAALPEQLAESELFGHAKGAFTGATGGAGLFADSEGGTIFLDEVGELAPSLQAKLLRVLATGEVRPVGETRTRHVETRVVAATNVDIEKAVEEGRFRGDLYSRLMGIVISIPGLEQRKEDILPLAAHFAARVRPDLVLSVDAQEALLIHPWRFNVRELRHTVEVSAATAGALLDLPDLPERFHAPFLLRPRDSTTSTEVPLPALVPPDRTPDAAGLRRVAEEMDGNVSRIAAYFGKSRRQIHRWAEQLGVLLGASRE